MNRILQTLLLVLCPMMAQWPIAEFKVGDRDLQTQSENGFYQVSFEALWGLYQREGREGALLGIPVQNLALLSSSVDTLPTRVLGPVQFHKLQSLALEVLDHSRGGAGPANGTFDFGDTLVFYGQGTSRWRGLNPTHSQFSSLPYGFENSVFSFERSYYLLDSRALALRPYHPISPSVSESQKEVLGLRRYEKDSLLIDTYFETEDRGTTGREFFWDWHKGGNFNKVKYNLVESHPLKGDLDSLWRPYGWVQVSYFPARHHYIVSPLDQLTFKTSGDYKRIDTLPLAQRMLGILPQFVSNGAYWVGEDQGKIQWSEYGFLGKNITLLPKANDFILGTVQTSDELRLDGVTISWYKGFELDRLGNANVWPITPSPGLQRFQLQKEPEVKGRVLRLDAGEWLGAEPIWEGNQFQDSTAVDRSFAVVSAQYRSPKIEIFTPYSSSRILNPWDPQWSQSLGRAQQLILCPRLFKDACVRLGDYRHSLQGGAVDNRVVVAEDIYGIYSAGQPSPQALRDFLRAAQSDHPSLRSVLLVGDTRLDQRNLWDPSRGPYLPVYSEMEMASDDYYGVLDSGACMTFRGRDCGRYKLSLGVGRLPVKTTAQIDAYLAKVQAYEWQKIGPWQSKMTFLADDHFQGLSVDAIPHVDSSESLAGYIRLLQPGLLQEKIYLDDYQSLGSSTKPKAHQQLMKALDEGRLGINFIGHGSVGSISAEGLLDQNQVPSLMGTGRSSFFSSFSCLVGRFDTPSGDCLMESLLFKPQGGAVASLAGMRDSWADRNGVLAHAFYGALLGGAQTFGQAYQKAKSSSVDLNQKYNDERYALLGDPELRVPQFTQTLSLKNMPDTLEGQQLWKFQGQTQTVANGRVQLLLQGAPYRKSWNDTLQSAYASAPPLILSDTGLYEGEELLKVEAEVRNGQFEFELYSPRSLSNHQGQARLWVLAWDSINGQRDRLNLDSIWIKGHSQWADTVQDTLAPQIKAYACGQSSQQAFADLIKVRAPACVEFEVADNLALDYSSDVDQGTVYRWQGDVEVHRAQWQNQKIQSGVFRVQLDSAWIGTRQLHVWSRDLKGNALHRSWDLEALSTGDQVIEDVYTQPNPMKSTTRFQFKILDPRITKVQVRLFDQAGQLVQVLNQIQPGQIWDGRDAFGNLLANGLYYYKLYITRSGDKGEEHQSRLQRLVISR